MKLKELEKVSQKGLKEQNKICNTLVQVYQEFANESTVHGIKYTAQAKTGIERLQEIMIQKLRK
jgi:hypothetical protein